jgi:hypothetical protein
VVHELEHRRCTCGVRVLVHHRDVLAVGGYRNHHDGRDLALHLYMYVGHESELSHHDGHVVRELVLRLYGNGLLVHHHDVRVVRVRVLRRCTCGVRVLDVHLHNGHVIRLAFRHPFAVVYRKDSKHHCCVLRHVLRRAVIRRDYGHLDRVVRGIRLLSP